MKILRAIFVISMLVVLLAAGAVGWVLFTQGGRDFAVRQVNGYTAKLATPVVVGRVTGNVLRDFGLASLTVADAGGVWLDVQGARLVWHPLALLDGVPPFEVLQVQSVRVARLPVAVSASEVKPEEGVVNPLDYMVYVPRNLRLEQVVVEPPVTGWRHVVRAEIGTVGGVQGISLSTLEGPVTAVSGTVALEAMDGGQVDLQVTEAPQGLLGGLLKLPARVGIAAEVSGTFHGDAVSVTLVDIRAGASRVVARGNGMRDGSRMVGTARVDVENLTELQGVFGVGVRGAVHGVVEVSGSLEKLGFGVVVSGSDVSVSGTRVAGLNGAVSGTVNVRETGMPLAATGWVSGTVSGIGAKVFPVKIMADVTGTTVAFEVSGSGVMVRKGERAVVRVGAAVGVSPMLVSGTMAGNWVQGKNTFTASGGVEIDPVRAVLRRLQVAGPGVAVSGSGVVDLAKYLVDGNAVVRVADLAPLGKLAGVDLKGGMDADVKAAAKAGVQTADVSVRRFEVGYRDYKAVLKQPARLVWDGRAGSVSQVILEIAGGTVEAAGRMSAGAVDGMLVVKNVDVGQLIDNDALSGRVNVDARVSGRPGAPIVVVHGGFEGVTGSYPVQVTADGNWRDGRLVLRGVGASRESSATVDVAVGGGLSLMPFQVGIGPASSLRGRVAARVPLEMFNTYLWASRMQVGGLLSGAVTLGGSLGAPEVGGRFVLADGSFVSSQSGVCLKGVGAEILGGRDRVEIRNLKSEDGEGGMLAGAGSVGLQGARAVSAEMRLGHFKLFCGGVASGTVDGGLTLQGTLADHTLAGGLVVGPLQVQLPGANRDADIPSVETIRVKAGAVASGPEMVTRLAVVVDAPQRIYVRGRGLDAEFGGKITVGGTADAPLLTGSLSALRGQYTLLDRTLKLVDTSVRFEGPIPPSPYLAIKATTTVQGTAITVNVTGTAGKPAIALTSDPSLPQDEVLALLLFGRKLANISAFEALKLAQATRVLAGLDGGEPGILDKARQTLGVDTLDIGTGEEAGDVTVTTGKYLTDKIYLSVQQGVEPEDREIKTEIELTPSVTGNTTVDGVGEQSFGLEWKKDY